MPKKSRKRTMPRNPEPTLLIRCKRVKQEMSVRSSDDRRRIVYRETWEYRERANPDDEYRKSFEIEMSRLDQLNAPAFGTHAELNDMKFQMLKRGARAGGDA